MNRPVLTRGAGRREPYVTLSYKWGIGRHFQLTKNNVHHLETCIPLNLLPKTFREAIQVTYDLGFRFFWIDALCIIQDDPVEKLKQIGCMGRIYSHSSLTIFAAAADNSDVGLSFERDSVLVKPTAISVKVELDESTYEFDLFVHKCNDAKPPKALPLYKRGWVLQEEVLSNRGLIFTADQIVWRCLYFDSSETKPGFSMRDDLGTVTGYSFSRLRLCLSSNSVVNDEPRWPSNGRRRGVLDEWYYMVEEYSKRQLTYSHDMIDAVTGISSSIETLWGYTFIAGLFIEDMQLGLLWRIRHNFDEIDMRSGASQLDTTQQSDLMDKRVETYWLRLSANQVRIKSFDGRPNRRGEGAQDSLFVPCPSWSWVSVHGTGSGVAF
jgi:hypothetical protein